MYKIKAPDGSNNIIGKNLKNIRKGLKPSVSQRMLAKKMQLAGFDIDYPVIRRIENGQRFVTDIELKALCQVLNISYETLLDE